MSENKLVYNENDTAGNTYDYVICTDAAVTKRSIKYPSTAGIVIIDKHGKTQRFMHTVMPSKVRTSNHAEAWAFSEGIRALQEDILDKIDMDPADARNQSILICTDSNLLYNHLNGAYKQKNPVLKELHRQIAKQSKAFGKVDVKWHRRNQPLADLADFVSKYPKESKMIYTNLGKKGDVTQYMVSASSAKASIKEKNDLIEEANKFQKENAHG